MATKPCISRNLRRIRAASGLSQMKVAKAAGISRVGYSAIESGRTESPKVGNLQAIARALGVGLAELLSVPDRPRTVRFRFGSLRGGRLEAQREQLVLDVARWLQDFNALEDMLEDRREYVLEGLGREPRQRGGSNRVIRTAEAARRALDLSDREPIRDICGLLESAGVKVWLVARDLDKFFGLSVASGDGGPAIVVNTRDGIPVERQIFTAAHELGHLLLHPGAYDVAKVNEDKVEEKEADTFASHFLMPSVAFNKEWEDTYGLRSVNRVLHVKRIFRVSYMTVLLRLAGLGREDSGKLIAVFRGQYKARTGKSLTAKAEPHPLADVDFIEERLSRLVRLAVERELITLSRAAEILGLALDEMRERARSWKVTV